MSISRHNVATLRRTLGITVSASGPDTFALAEKVGLRNSGALWAQDVSKEVFSGCLVWQPCFPASPTRLWLWNSGLEVLPPHRFLQRNSIPFGSSVGQIAALHQCDKPFVRD